MKKKKAPGFSDVDMSFLCLNLLLFLPIESEHIAGFLTYFIIDSLCIYNASPAAWVRPSQKAHLSTLEKGEGATVDIPPQFVLIWVFPEDDNNILLHSTC